VPEVGWRDQLVAWAAALRDVYQRHGWMADVPISGLPAGPQQMAWFEQGLQALAGATLRPGERASTALRVATFVRAQTQLVQDLARASDGVDRAGVVRQVADPAGSRRSRRWSRPACSRTPGGVPGRRVRVRAGRILDGVGAVDRSRVSG
jgi:Tetracyclin repressor-like, C-terminal domain